MVRATNLLAAAIVCLALGAGASAQPREAWPSKPVRLIIPAAPGGNPDVLARLLAPKLADALGKPFVVENMPGAGGVVAAEAVVKMPPDGHGLFIGESAAMAIIPALNPRIGYHPLRDFTLVTGLVSLPTVLVVNPSVPAASLQEFVALARSKPSQIAYGSPGNGSIHHLTMGMFATRAGLDMLHVPYKGGSPMVAAVLAGEIQAGWSGIPNVQQSIKAGKLRALAISTAKRSASLPEVPTAAELGFPGFDVATVLGVQAPAGLAPDIVARLQAAIAKAIREPDIAPRIAGLGMELVENGTLDYVRFAKEDFERFSAAVKSLNLRQE